MALVLRTNGAPLSGALFVSNPRKRIARRNRRNGLALRTNRRNRRNRRNAAIQALRKRRSRRNTMLLNYHGNGLALKANRRSRRRSLARRNSYGSFQNKLTAPISNIVGKAPVIGSIASQYVAPLAMGVVVGGVHYGVIAALSKVPVVADVIEKVNPVKYTLTGVAAATALRFLPVGSKEIRDQVAVGALLAGSALDMYRFLSGKVGDLGGLYEDGFIETGDLYEDGFIEAGGLYEDGFVEVGDGGMYDVVPLSDGSTVVNYSGASMMDAAVAPADLSVDEGEAALAGPWDWYQRFGTPAYAPHRVGGYSAMVGQPGHRFGWLIELVGFPRFQKIAALPPARRVALIAQLKQQAISSVDGYSGLALDMNGLALDMNGLALDMNGTTLDFSGSLAGLALDMNGMGAVMHAGSSI